MYHLNIFTTLRSHNAVLVDDASAHQKRKKIAHAGYACNAKTNSPVLFTQSTPQFLHMIPRSHKMGQTIWQGGKKTAKN